MPERPYHHGNLREALLDRAVVVIEAEGVDGLSLRQLARDLGVSHGAPARHFRDRQALIDALAHRGFTVLNAALSAAAYADEDFQIRFRALGRAYLSFALEHPALLSTMYTLKHHPDAGDLRELGGQGMEFTRELIEQAQAAGEIGPGNASLFAASAFAAVHGAASLGSEGFAPDVPIDVLADTLADLLWAAMSVGHAVGP